MPTIDAEVLNKVAAFLADHHIDDQARIGVAFSGGSDSLALLLALRQLYTPDHLHVMYVQHHLRPSEELRVEMALNGENCLKLGIGLRILDLGEGSVAMAAVRRRGGLEEAARHLRYEALYDECARAGCTHLATAHNADDQLETTLMRLFQGASITALEGVRQVRTVEGSKVTLIRPVLACSHAQLADYVRQHAMIWSEDSTNNEDAYLRNAIRHTITPPILSVFGGAYDAIALMSRRFGEVGRLLDSLTEHALKAVSFMPDCAEFSRSWFTLLAPPIRELVLFRIIAHFETGERIKGSFIQRLRKALEESGDGGNWVLQSGSFHCKLDQDVCTCYKVDQGCWHFCRQLANPGATQIMDLGNDVIFRSIPYEQGSVDPDLLALDATQLDTAVLRSVQLSDEICLEGGTVKVTKLISSYKIPKHLYPLVVVLADRSGLVAVFARFLGGRDRLAKRFKAPLARRLTNIYSSNKRNNCSEIEKRQPR